MKELRDNTWKQIENDRLAVVKVSASWCGPCKVMKSHFYRWSERWNVYNGEKIKYYEVDGEKCPKFYKEFNIDRYPTTLFFIYGVLVFKLHGMVRGSVFEDLLKKSLEIPFERTYNENERV